MNVGDGILGWGRSCTRTTRRQCTLRQNGLQHATHLGCRDVRQVATVLPDLLHDRQHIVIDAPARYVSERGLTQCTREHTIWFCPERLAHQARVEGRSARQPGCAHHEFAHSRAGAHARQRTSSVRCSSCRRASTCNHRNASCEPGTMQDASLYGRLAHLGFSWTVRAIGASHDERVKQQVTSFVELWDSPLRSSQMTRCVR